MKENIMSEELYNELLKAYSKEVLADMIKADIQQRFSEPYASMYCQCYFLDRYKWIRKNNNIGFDVWAAKPLFGETFNNWF